MIEINRLSHRYGDKIAVAGLTLRVGAGEIHGLIGPDGAGKTSTMRVLTTLIPKQAGDLKIAAIPIEDYRRLRPLLGYMPQQFSLYPDLSVGENLDFYASIFSLSGAEKEKRLQELYAFSGLAPYQDRPAGKLSGGMKQKLALMCALIHTPRVLILDEPTTGVDPVSRADFWEILHQVAAEGIPIFVSTPYMDEASQCDRVTLLNKGRQLASGKPEELIAASPIRVWHCIWSKSIDSVQNSGPENFIGAQPFGKRLHLYWRQNTLAAEVINFCREQQLESLSASFAALQMEDIFIYHMAYENA
jgi:ABC-2 type transport system ATP-binding protein